MIIKGKVCVIVRENKRWRHINILTSSGDGEKYGEKLLLEPVNTSQTLITWSSLSDVTGPGSFNSDQQHVVLSANCSQLTVRLFRRFYHWFSVGIFIAELLDYDNITNVKFRLSPSPHTPRHSSLIWSGKNIWLIYFGEFDPLQSSVLNCKVNSLMWQHSQVTNI